MLFGVASWGSQLLSCAVLLLTWLFEPSCGATIYSVDALGTAVSEAWAR